MTKELEEAVQVSNDKYKAMLVEQMTAQVRTSLPLPAQIWFYVAHVCVAVLVLAGQAARGV